MKKIRRIPTLIGLFILIAGLVAGVVLIRQGPTWLLRAGPQLTPQQVKVTNVSDDSFTVSWTTDAETPGFVKCGTGPDLTLTVVDDRDQLSGTTDSFSNHHVTLKNLNPSTDYFFKVGSGGQLFDNNGQPYQVKTGPAIQSPTPANDVAYGTIISQDSSSVSGVIVYLALANTTPLSTLTKSSGSWVIPLNLARSTDLASYATYDREASIEEIFIQGGQLGTATAVTTTKNDSPVPAITLGQSFDFRKIVTTGQLESEPTSQPASESAEEATDEGQATSSASRFNLQEATSSPTLVELAIINPEQGESLNNLKPEFLGTGPTGKVLRITVQSPGTYSGTIVVDAQGDWQWTPPADLEPGEHTVTINYTDENDQEHTASRTFTVLAAGESELPAFTATPSGEATLSPTPTTSPTVTPTTPPTSTRAAMPSTDEGVPTPGILIPTFLIFIMGLVLTSLGIGISLLKI